MINENLKNMTYNELIMYASNLEKEEDDIEKEIKTDTLKLLCSRCEDRIIKMGKRGCAWRSLGNDYCFEKMDYETSLNKICDQMVNPFDKE